MQAEEDCVTETYLIIGRKNGTDNVRLERHTVVSAFQAVQKLRETGWKCYVQKMVYRAPNNST